MPFSFLVSIASCFSFSRSWVQCFTNACQELTSTSPVMYLFALWSCSHILALVDIECVLYRWVPAPWWDSGVNVHMYELSFLTESLWAILSWRWSSISSPSGLTVSTGEAMTMGRGGSSDANVLVSQVWLQYPAAYEWAGCDSLIIMLVLGRQKPMESWGLVVT